MISLVTGITGHAASYLTEQLLERGDTVIGVHRRSSSLNTSRLPENDRLTLAEADLLDFPSLVLLLRKYKPSRIYNTAAQSHVHTSFGQPAFTFDVTGKGVLNLLEAIRLTEIDTRLIQFSSSEQFGDQYDELVLPSAGPTAEKPYRLPCGNLTTERIFRYQDENTRMNPQSPYAIAKLAAYNFVRLYRQAYGLFASNAIMFNYESPRRGENFVTRKITRYIADLQRSNFSSPKLHLGNIHSCRDWSFTGDTMRGVISIGEHSIPDDFVLASGHTHAVSEFLSAAFRHIGVPDWQSYVTIDNDLKRPAEVPFLRGYPRKACRDLRWTPQTSFEELVALMVDADLERLK